MRKITDYLVEKRYYVFTIFIIFMIGSIFLDKYVNINYDILEYLPKDSNTKIGLDIMNENFQNETSTLNIMVKDLSEEEKEKTYNYLENVEHIQKVEYENTEEYNKDNYTLYKLTIDDTSDSATATNIYNKIKNHFQDTLVDTSGDISTHNKDVLPFYIVVIAVLSALVILIITSESYVEPFLFLITILSAVLLNKGTNIIFPTVSNITISITSILQMALSMDYSIMLTNRYRQEKLQEKDKVKAMKNAIYHSFGAVLSSSVTTIVGLLALVFMTFTIGRDLGFVLAKGVLFSLISVFTILPTLLLACDKLILKTKKKSISFKLDGLGHFVYKMRYGAFSLFIILFITGFILKGNLGILFTNDDNEISKVFKSDNEIALIYDKKDEDIITDFCQKNANRKEVKDILCYSNTISEPLLASEVNNKLADLDVDTKVEDYMLKIIYYHYNNKEENNKINLNNLINFIKNDVYKNENMSQDISKNMRNNIDKLSNFASEKNINKKRNMTEIGNLLNIDKNTLNNLIILYNSLNNNVTLSLDEFVNVLNNNKDKLDNATLTNLDLLNTFTNKEVINKKLDKENLAKMFNISPSLVEKVFLYSLNTEIVNYKMTLNEFTNILIENNLMDDENELLLLLQTFSDKELLTTKMSQDNLKQIFGVSLITSLNLEGEYTPYEIITIINNNELLKGNIPNFNLMYTLATSTINEESYNYENLSKLLNLEEEMVKNIYILNYQDSYLLTPLEFSNVCLNANMIKENLDEESLNNLSLVSKIMTSTNNKEKYNSQELSQFLNIEKDKVNLIYGLSLPTDIKLSLNEFINFLVNNVLNNKEYNTLSKDAQNNLKIVKTIMANSLKNKTYTKDELYNLLHPLASDLDHNLVDLVYIYYGSVNEYPDNLINLEDFVIYLNDDILKDKRFDNYIADDLRSDIKKSYNDVIDAKEKLVSDKYNRALIRTNLPLEGKDTYKFIDSIKEDLGKTNYYLVGDSLMAYEMDKTFNNEMNLITILTFLFIFLVVSKTFKSFKISLILGLLIQCAVYLIMGILSFSGSVYFISLLIVQSILMGATIDYAILYTSYYLEERKNADIRTSLINAYNNSIHTIFTSASILIIVTLIIGLFASEVAAKICKTLSEGTICATILIIFILPELLASLDKYIIRQKVSNKNK